MLESDPLVLPPVSELFALERSLPLTNEGTEERRELKNFPYADGYSKKIVSRQMYGTTTKISSYSKTVDEAEPEEEEEEEEETDAHARDNRLAPMLLEQSYTHTPPLAAEPMQPTAIYSEVMLPSNLLRLDLNVNNHHHQQQQQDHHQHHRLDNYHMHNGSTSNNKHAYYHHERSQSAPNMIRYCAAGGSNSSDCVEQDGAAATVDRSRKYQCHFCHKRFARPSSLRTHTYSHTGQRPFPCTFEGCDKRFSVLSNMRRHLRRHHQQQNDSFLTRSNSVASSNSTATTLSTGTVLSDYFPAAASSTACPMVENE